MLSTALVVAGLSTGNKIGLATVGGAFIVFALVSSFVLPRRNPNFPGRAVGWYSALGVLFFVAMTERRPRLRQGEDGGGRRARQRPRAR